MTSVLPTIGVATHTQEDSQTLMQFCIMAMKLTLTKMTLEIIMTVETSHEILSKN